MSDALLRIILVIFNLDLILGLDCLATGPAPSSLPTPFIFSLFHSLNVFLFLQLSGILSIFVLLISLREFLCFLNLNNGRRRSDLAFFFLVKCFSYSPSLFFTFFLFRLIRLDLKLILRHAVISRDSADRTIFFFWLWLCLHLLNFYMLAQLFKLHSFRVLSLFLIRFLMIRTVCLNHGFFLFLYNSFGLFIP